jgi:PAS domain S-box-containing protein
MNTPASRLKRRRCPSRGHPPVLNPGHVCLRMLAENFHDIFFSLRFPEGRYEYISPAVQTLFGLSPQDFYRDPLTVLRCIAPAWRNQVRTWMEELAQGKIADEYEFQVIDKTGRLRWLRQRQIMVSMQQGRSWRVQGLATEVSGSRKEEETLRETSHRYALFADNLVDIIWALDAELRWTYLSPSAETFLDMPLDRLILRTLEQTFTPASLKRVKEALQHWDQNAALPREKTSLWLMLDIYDAHGGLVPVEVLARPIRNIEGRITGYCGIARDIRPRKRMERVEAGLSRLARELLECEDLAQTQVLTAACAADLTGASLVQAARRDLESGLMLGPDGQPLPDALPNDALSLTVLHAEEDVGRLIALGVAPENALEARELLERVASLFALALARIRAEGALRKSERMARMLLESMHEGVWALDRNKRAIFANERLADMLGYSVAEIMVLRPEDVLDPSQLQIAQERFQERCLGRPGSKDYELQRKDGTRLLVHVSSSAILDENGGFEGLVCTAIDLSERKHMEEELRHNQARFEALLELSRLTSATEPQMAAFTLREALRLTGSTAGVLFFVGATGKDLVPMASSGDRNISDIRTFATVGNTPWALVHAMRHPLVLNDFHLFTQQIPSGHVPVERFLGVPALDGDKPAAILGLTGKDRDYTADDSLQVALLMDGMWRIVRSRRDEERIRASLREKEALLREVHHRVKNNLQVVSSLLDMAGRRLSEAEARRSMEEVRAKVLAMSLVHAQLHGEGVAGDGPGRGIDLERYVQALFRQLREIYSGGMELFLMVLLGELTLGLDQAAPLGLALNEVLANVFKHGRREGQPGRVYLRAWREDDGQVCIEVRDNGPGLPAGLVPERATTLGLKLMFGLVRNQLGGELRFASGPTGVCVCILFRPVSAV